jgi:hypothetical protein
VRGAVCGCAWRTDLAMLDLMPPRRLRHSPAVEEMLVPSIDRSARPVLPPYPNDYPSLLHRELHEAMMQERAAQLLIEGEAAKGQPARLPVTFPWPWRLQPWAPVSRPAPHVHRLRLHKTAGPGRGLLMRPALPPACLPCTVSE